MKHNKRGMIMVITMMLMPICIILGAILLSNLIAEKNNLRYEPVGVSIWPRSESTPPTTHSDPKTVKPSPTSRLRPTLPRNPASPSP